MTQQTTPEPEQAAVEVQAESTEEVDWKVRAEEA